MQRTLTWTGYNYRPYDGYGRYSGYLVRALERAGVHVTPVMHEQTQAAGWLRARWGIDLSRLTLACMPPFGLRALPPGSGPLWLLTMTEGDELPPGWADLIRDARVARVIVPCEHNAAVFRAGLDIPVSVVPGGTCPDEFPLRPAARPDRPFTFLALADRGARKGWVEVWEAFYQAFGRPQDTPDVRLIVKSRPDGNDLLTRLIAAQAASPDADPRLDLRQTDLASLADLLAEVDVFAIPSRSEGWGMPHREAAMQGIPVITQAYAGLDDGHTSEWALVVGRGTPERICLPEDAHVAGTWRKADVDDVAAWMRWCYERPDLAYTFGQRAAAWLRANQTWDHSAAALIRLLDEEDAWR